MMKTWIKSLIISGIMLLVCFGLSACKEKNNEIKYTLNIYVDNKIHQTVELKENEIETYTLPEMKLKKDELYYFSGWTGDIEDNKLKVDSNSLIITISGSYKPIFSVSENGELGVDENETTKSFEELIVPSVINNINVTTLGDHKFWGFNNLKMISLPSTLETISYGTFKNCKNLQRISIPDNVKKIDEDAFYGCINLEEVNIDENSKLQEIGLWAFYDCEKLKSITIPKGVVKIGPSAFKNCYKLETINYNAINCLNPKSDSYYNVIFSNTGINTDGVTLNIGNLVTKIPGGICWNPINFVNINLKQINFCENTTCETIGESAFENCYNLKKVTIPETIKEIGFYAFKDCYNLSEINYNAKNIPNPQHSPIGNSKFLKAGQNSNQLILNIGENVENIPSYLFEDSCITEINFNDDNKCSSIGEQAFWAWEKLKEITIPKTITTIGNSAFSCCTNLETIYFNAIECSNFTENHKIFDKRYEEDKSYKVIFGTSVKRIPDYIFYGCKWINEAQFAENSVCESIGVKSFYACKNLQKVEIPKSIFSIGIGAVAHCSNLTEIYYNASMCNGFEYNNNILKPFEDSGSYCEKSSVYIGKDVEYIPSHMFKNSDITNLIFDKESKCDAISAGAFYFCNKLEYAIISTSLTTIDSQAFNYIKSEFIVYFLGLEGNFPEFGSTNDIEYIYYYSTSQPQESGKYWHYDTDGKTPIVWGITE